MSIEKVVNPHKTTDKQSDEVWANIEMDELRRKECLCFNCEGTLENSPANECPVAKKLYELSVKYDMAMAITRCGATDERGNLLYIPRKK
ncbi:Uncharacterised protein [uncultured archaeon]|nr:Uncharacterised protein [uncultured archaeon]